MVVWPQNLKFCLFYIVNLASTANIFFWGMDFQHSVNIQWLTPQGRPLTTFQIPRSPYPTKSYSNLKVQNLKFLLQNNSFVNNIKYILSWIIFHHAQLWQVGVVVIVLRLQWRAIETRHLLKRKDVSFILTIFPKTFWNKWYLLWKPP